METTPDATRGVDTLIEVRLPIDMPKLAAYLRLNTDFFLALGAAAKDPAACEAELAAKQFDNGMSNPTYLLYRRSAPLSGRMVLRKQPPGAVARLEKRPACGTLVDAPQPMTVAAMPHSSSALLFVNI